MYIESPVARRIPDDRFKELLEAATQVFIEHGYRRTQMADVAAAMKVAKGTLYLYVESKEALFDTVLRHVDTDAWRAKPPAFPIKTPRPDATVRYVRDELARRQTLAALVAALGRRKVDDPAAELAGILTELYDTLAQNRRRLRLLDRSARDYPALAALWFQGARGGLLALLARYIDDRVRGGHFRRLPDTGVTARLILEALVFWAVHRHWDQAPETPEGEPVSDEVARATVVRFAVNALVKE